MWRRRIKIRTRTRYSSKVYISTYFSRWYIINNMDNRKLYYVCLWLQNNALLLWTWRSEIWPERNMQRAVFLLLCVVINHDDGRESSRQFVVNMQSCAQVIPAKRFANILIVFYTNIMWAMLILYSESLWRIRSVLTLNNINLIS